MVPILPTPAKADDEKPTRSSLDYSSPKSDRGKGDAQEARVERATRREEQKPPRSESKRTTQSSSSRSEKSDKTKSTRPLKQDDGETKQTTAHDESALRCHKCRSKMNGDDKCSKCRHACCEKCEKESRSHRVKTHKDGKKRHSSQGPDQRTEPQSSRSEVIAKAASALRKRSSGLIKISSTRRICHECEAKFSLYDGLCHNCYHLLCSKCPEDRSSTERSKHDESASKDRIVTQVRQRIRYTCDQCSTLFDERTKVCSSCGHELCRKCRREPPKRICHPESSRTKHGRETSPPPTTAKSDAKDPLRESDLDAECEHSERGPLAENTTAAPIAAA